jgi:hypothetical protein
VTNIDELSKTSHRSRTETPQTTASKPGLPIAGGIPRSAHAVRAKKGKEVFHMSHGMGMRVLAVFGLATLVAFFCPSTRELMAQSANSSAKVTVKSGDISLIQGPITTGSQVGDWHTILQNTLKTSNAADLLITASLECGLYTNTLVASKNGTADTSIAKATIQVQVLIDGQTAIPGVVTYASRNQTLSATLQGMFTSGSITVDPVTGAVTINTALLTAEQIQLILETLDANSFQFVLPSVGTGIHTIQVQARIDLGVSYQAGSASAQATIGKGTLSVEAVRLVEKNANITF